jgi:hypothetical protein
MTRRRVILNFIFSIAALIGVSFGCAHLAETTQIHSILTLGLILTIALTLSAIAFGFMIFASVMTNFLLWVVPAETIQRKSGNPIYYLQWLEVRAKFDALKKER